MIFGVLYQQAIHIISSDWKVKVTQLGWTKWWKFMYKDRKFFGKVIK